MGQALWARGRAPSDNDNPPIGRQASLFLAIEASEGRFARAVLRGILDVADIAQRPDGTFIMSFSLGASAMDDLACFETALADFEPDDTGEEDDAAEDDAIREASLGALAWIDQRQWAAGDGFDFDLEGPETDRAPHIAAARRRRAPAQPWTQTVLP